MFLISRIAVSCDFVSSHGYLLLSHKGHYFLNSTEDELTLKISFNSCDKLFSEVCIPSKS